MQKFMILSFVSLAMGSTSLSAGAAPSWGEVAGTSAHGEATVWLAKGNNGNGNGNGKAKPRKANEQDGRGNGNGKPEHAGAPKPKPNRTEAARPSNGNGNGNAKVRPKARTERSVDAGRMAPAPDARDMTRVLGAAALGLATPGLAMDRIPNDELITYRNCPPGLAKKNPPCVPPGLAKQGVTYDQWASNDLDDYDGIWLDRRREWLRGRGGVTPDPSLLLLRSDQIATLFGLDPAPVGKRYALIDGLPVLLDDDDYTSLLLLNQIARAAGISEGLRIAPTAALTQGELIDLYRLPRLGADQNYAVVNGQLLRLSDAEYDVLQMMRIARAIF